MSVIFAEGFDNVPNGSGFSNSSLLAIMDNISGSNDQNVSATLGRFGGGAMMVNRAMIVDKHIDPLGTGSYTTIIVGFSFKQELLGDWKILAFMDSLGNEHGAVRITGPGKFIIVDSNDAATAASAGGFSVSTWHFMEVKIVLGPTGSMEIRLDQAQDESGVVIEVTSGDFKATGPDIFAIRWFKTGTLNNGSFYDDIHILDTAGSRNNDFIGDGRIHTLRPNVDQGPNDMALVGGSGDHYTLVDEAQHDDTDYLESPSIGNKENFGFENLPSGGAAIDFVTMVSRVTKNDGGGIEFKQHVLQGASENQSDAVSPLTSKKYYYHHVENDPSTSAQWLRSAVSSTEGGVEVA